MKARKPSGKSFFIVISVTAVLLVVAVLLFLFLPKGISDDTTVAYVNGIPVSYGEYMLVAEEKRGETAAYFYENHHVDENVDFWSKEAVFGGENPLEVHKKAVLEAVTEIKLQQQLMMEYGIVSENDITYKGFFKLFEQENLRRRKITEQGDVIYGPEQYTESGYYNYLHNIRLQELREAMYAESGSKDISDKFTDALLVERLAEMQENVQVDTVPEVYKDIKAFSQD